MLFAGNSDWNVQKTKRQKHDTVMASLKVLGMSLQDEVSGSTCLLLDKRLMLKAWTASRHIKHQVETHRCVSSKLTGRVGK